MGLGDRVGNAGRKLAGKFKEATGRANGDDRLRAEGKKGPAQGGPQTGCREGEGRVQEALTTGKLQAVFYVECICDSIDNHCNDNEPKIRHSSAAWPSGQTGQGRLLPEAHPARRNVMVFP